MKPVWWMVGASAVSGVVAAVIPGIGEFDVLLGMLAPLVAAVATWVLVVRTYRRNPVQLTPLMIKGFGAKMVLFGVYVSVVLTSLPVQPIPFVVSFTVYFIGLHLAEALFMQRLFAGGMDGVRPR